MSEPVRAAVYVRVSTERQAKEGLSLDEQRRRVEAYVATHGWTLRRRCCAISPPCGRRLPG